MEFFDSHCHLQAAQFDPDREAVIARALAQQVRMLTIGTDAASSRSGVQLARKHSGVYACVGIHPTETSRATEDDYRVLRELIAGDNVLAIGETGLDFYHHSSPRAVQEEHFRRHIALAQETGLPLVLHARDSVCETLEIVEPFLRAGGKAVWHCFSASKKLLPQMVERVKDLNLYVGISGMITFEDQKSLQEAVTRIPDKHLLLDSDSPYLIPRPRELDRNEPAQAVRIARKLAELRGVRLEDIARITTRNACDFLGLPAPEEMRESKLAYPIRNSLYLNLTAQCNNNCVFCGRNRGYVVKGHDLALDHDPDAAEMIAAMGDVSAYDEVVFCGYGEPTMRLEVLKEVARYLKGRGQKVRLNTNGLADLQYGREVAPELVGLIDAVSISLNTADPAQYDALCRSRYGARAYPAMLAFARSCLKAGLRTVLTVVAMPDIDVEAARKVALEVGAEFRVRSFVDAG